MAGGFYSGDGYIYISCYTSNEKQSFQKPTKSNEAFQLTAREAFSPMPGSLLPLRFLLCFSFFLTIFFTRCLSLHAENYTDELEPISLTP